MNASLARLLTVICLFSSQIKGAGQEATDYLAGVVRAGFSGREKSIHYEFERTVKAERERKPLSDEELDELRKSYRESLSRELGARFEQSVIDAQVEIRVDLDNELSKTPNSYGVSGDVVIDLITPLRWKVTSEQPFLNQPDRISREIVVSNGKGLIAKNTVTVGETGKVLPPANLFRIEQFSMAPLIDLAPWLPEVWLGHHVNSDLDSWSVTLVSENELLLTGEGEWSGTKGRLIFDTRSLALRSLEIELQIPGGTSSISKSWERTQDGWIFESLIPGESDKFVARVKSREEISSSELTFFFPIDPIATLVLDGEEIDLPVAEISNKSFDLLNIEEKVQ